MLDIDSLRMTEEELDDSLKRLVIQGISGTDYQLAKALWGVTDWLGDEEDGFFLEAELWTALKQAGIERPR